MQFAEWDLLRGRLPGVFDLVVVMDVLECFLRRSDLHAIRAKIANLVAAGSCCLVTTTKESDVVEAAWWGRWLIRGKHINHFIARHPAPTVCSTASTDTHVLTLYRKQVGS